MVVGNWAEMIFWGDIIGGILGGGLGEGFGVSFEKKINLRVDSCGFVCIIKRVGEAQLLLLF